MEFAWTLTSVLKEGEIGVPVPQLVAEVAYKTVTPSLVLDRKETVHVQFQSKESKE